MMLWFQRKQKQWALITQIYIFLSHMLINQTQPIQPMQYGASQTLTLMLEELNLILVLWILMNPQLSHFKIISQLLYMKFSIFQVFQVAVFLIGLILKQINHTEEKMNIRL
ncbi:transmembrane protein, putative (macronuclear) [Tetrahymena thermophila SB210]|uniref:Transmembrane protein, putative n=1 Tax=Tetrahymena thermophila (strain SB210) TaxID=312017 RepID=W7XKR2_TETTS|nr:transmembrane protein, putative [Tetrahymena thermophila SB210]EWS76746.1 transmembrane protein, putative [Tetrahymena thermophila SB210]|eukprot:XP_012650739.1 transmembrane protein, putative [Tetrahymena thermophila SB210]